MKNNFSEGMKESFILMIIAVISISLSNFFAKLSLHFTSEFFITFIRFLIPFILIIFYSFLTNSFKNISFNNIKIHFIRGIALTCSQLFLFTAMKKLSMTEAVVLYNTGPIFIVLISYFFLKKDISLNSILGVFLGGIGVVFISNVTNFHINWYLSYGLMSGVCFAISQICLHTSTKKEKNISTMFFLYLFCSIFSFLLEMIFDHHTNHGLFRANSSALVLLFLVGLASLSNQLFRGLAYKKTKSAACLAPVIYLSIFISVVLDFICFHVTPTFHVIVGSFLIIFGSYLSATKSFKIPKLQLKKG